MGDPQWELGPVSEGRPRGEDTRQLQFYLGPEIEFTPQPRSRFHLLLRVHHRSGGYGVISPLGTGSNYLSLGLRVDLR
jgi:hypothetical protein